MNVKYRIISGSIELDTKLPLHIDVFPVSKDLITLINPFFFFSLIESSRNGGYFLTE